MLYRQFAYKWMHQQLYQLAVDLMQRVMQKYLVKCVVLVSYSIPFSMAN